MGANPILKLSARFDQVALVGTEALVIRRAPRLATVRWAQGLVVLVVPLAAVQQVECRLDVSAADLHGGGSCVLHMLRCKTAALAKGTIASSPTEHQLVLDVDLLVVVQAQ